MVCTFIVRSTRLKANQICVWRRWTKRGAQRNVNGVICVVYSIITVCTDLQGDLEENVVQHSLVLRAMQHREVLTFSRYGVFRSPSPPRPSGAECYQHGSSMPCNSNIYNTPPVENSVVISGLKISCQVCFYSPRQISCHPC